MSSLSGSTDANRGLGACSSIGCSTKPRTPHLSPTWLSPAASDRPRRSHQLTTRCRAWWTQGDTPMRAYTEGEARTRSPVWQARMLARARRLSWLAEKGGCGCWRLGGHRLGEGLASRDGDGAGILLEELIRSGRSARVPGRAAALTA